MICSKCKTKETDSTSGLCWWCVNNADEIISRLVFSYTDAVKGIENSPFGSYKENKENLKSLLTTFAEKIRESVVGEVEENKSFRIEIGQNCYKDNKNDYAGKVGYVYFCNKCCNDWRIQFFSIGNNELLRNFNLKNCTIFFADY